MSTRSLQPGDPIPMGTPKRYLNDRGYIRLRWLIAPNEYVEVYEHRFVMGVPSADIEVHHLNGDKTDNRPANLICLSKSDHAKLHAYLEPNRMLATRKPRQPLSEYPRCSVDRCERAAQCMGRTVCLKHYKAILRRSRRVVSS